MEFKHIQGLTPDGTVYYNEDMGTLEAMVPPGKYSTAHAPALLELENGDRLCAWFAGSFEGSKDISLCAQDGKMAVITGVNRSRFPMIVREVNRILPYLKDRTVPYGVCIQHS